ncbi:hypothetical protein CYMTET_17764 [Cymbomonas tetramitiformis]|uniref:TRAPPC10/Trs130 N-terminal domain-containing protein n=1 Tax=Cymbomonas tetramitiformis TaxID=36881 RepID=A0AAE0G995_9CHLO|nr:hypothetical protein CYMTET_17764 [Cymbomonas tetramitiformis]
MADKILKIMVRDICDIWEDLKPNFTARLPLKQVRIRNGKDPVPELPLHYILPDEWAHLERTDTHQSLWSPMLLRPFTNLIILSCDDVEEYKQRLKTRLRETREQVERSSESQWLVVLVRLPSSGAGRNPARLYDRLRSDTRSKDRCCYLDLSQESGNCWDELEERLAECLRETFEERASQLEAALHRMEPASNTSLPSRGWFSQYFLAKDSCAMLYTLAGLFSDALEEYRGLQCETMRHLEAGTFGGTMVGDDEAALLDPGRKPLNWLLLHCCEFDLRQYLFAQQSQLHLLQKDVLSVVRSGLLFIANFAEILDQRAAELPAGLRHAWLITACLALTQAVKEGREGDKTTNTFIELHQLTGKLFLLARSTLLQLGKLVHLEVSMKRRQGPCASSCGGQCSRIEDSNAPGAEDEGAASRSPAGSPRGAPTETPGAPTPACEGPTEPVDALDALIPKLTGPHSSAGSFDSADDVTNLAAHISHEDLREALSSQVNFDDMYTALTCSAADQYYMCKRQRAAAKLDGDVAELRMVQGDYRGAEPLLKRQCELYARDGWNVLLAHQLPLLTKCRQKMCSPDLPQTYLQLLSLPALLLQPSLRSQVCSHLAELSAPQDCLAEMEIEISQILQLRPTVAAAGAGADHKVMPSVGTTGHILH